MDGQSNIMYKSVYGSFEMIPCLLGKLASNTG